MEVEIRRTERRRVIAMRHTGPYPEIGKVFDRIVQWATEHSVRVQGALAIFYSDPTSVPAEELQSDACVVVPSAYSTDVVGVTEFEIPEQTCAVGRYIGPYSGLPGAWGEFMSAWFPASGLEMDANHAPYEVYTNDPRTTAPELLETLLHQPVKT
jgi:AraC family transcriptional regulator